MGHVLSIRSGRFTVTQDEALTGNRGGPVLMLMWIQGTCPCMAEMFPRRLAYNIQVDIWKVEPLKTGLAPPEEPQKHCPSYPGCIWR